MAYCTQSDLNTTEAILVRLTDDEGSGVVNASRVAAAIEAAEGQINASLRARYLVPLSAPIPVLIRTICADLALHRLMVRRGDVVQVPDWLSKTVAAHELDLAQIKEGRLDLGVEPVPASSSKAVATVDLPDLVMTDDTLKDF